MFAEQLKRAEKLSRDQAGPELHALHDGIPGEASDGAAPLEMHRGTLHVRFPIVRAHQGVEFGWLAPDEKEPVQIAPVVVEEDDLERLNGPFAFEAAEVLNEILEMRRADFLAAGQRAIPGEEDHVGSHLIHSVVLVKR